MRQLYHGLFIIWLVLVGSIVMSQAQTHTDMQHSSHMHGHAQETPGPLRITMEELHQHGGVPPGWQFSLPEGKAEAGRQAFIDLSCYQCHTISGEQLPPVAASQRSPGPDLTGMGAHHPAAYFAEAILQPNKIILIGPGYTDADGLSIMPDNYADLLTVRQLLDLVAYLRSLQTPMTMSPHDAGRHMHHAPAAQPQGGMQTPHR